MEKWQDPKVLAFWIAIIIIFIATLLFFVVRILHAGYKRMTEANLRETELKLDHQKMLLETSLVAQEKERMRIASDLHDSLIGRLTVIRMKSHTEAGLQELDSLLGESIAEARRISHDLTPPLLEHLSLQELVEDLLNPWKQKLEISFYSDVRTDAVLSVQVKIQVVRVVQELLVNIIKHAAATGIAVHLRHTDKYLVLSVKDNGRGFDTSGLKKGLGLNSLELRMQYLGAKYRVKSKSGKGTTALIAMAT